MACVLFPYFPLHATFVRDIYVQTHLLEHE